MAVPHFPLRLAKFGKTKASGKNLSGTLMRNLSGLVAQSLPAIETEYSDLKGTTGAAGFFCRGWAPDPSVLASTDFASSAATASPSRATGLTTGPLAADAAGLAAGCLRLKAMAIGIAITSTTSCTGIILSALTLIMGQRNMSAKLTTPMMATG